MSFKDAIVSVFQNYVNFSGRARRSEYWYFVLFNFIVGFVLGFLGRLVGGDSLFNPFQILSGLYSLAVLIPTLALCWRRLHDIGRSGGWYFIALVPLVGAILLLIWFCTDSQSGTNQYGPNPKESEGTYGTY